MLMLKRGTKGTGAIWDWGTIGTGPIEVIPAKSCWYVCYRALCKVQAYLRFAIRIYTLSQPAYPIGVFIAYRVSAGW